ncbi:MAG TPA: hydantoinase B/oxoprolinase family protein [Gaiellaceae bacterium]|jgi:5-oxoprolinase (ATP-hydrolysing)/N-methylhydantoinase A|nr:hydantoinase B/oxoprolinase family protein [Gaiellaceae bacterium]
MRIGADVGGTFTDVLVLDPGGGVRFTKVLSTPPDYDRAVVGAVRELAGESAGEVDAVVHGTTVATNAVLERRGAVTVLVTTEGFRDVLELRRMRMPHLYDYFWTKPPSLVPRHLRLEVPERMTASGAVLKPLDESAAQALAVSIRELRPESVAVCLLHAHVNPEHERRLGEILRTALPDVPITLSSEILREQQEYERTATTVVNAYVRPLMERYLGSIRNGLDEAGIAAPLTLMQSAGGVMSAEDGARRPVYALESGPAAGVIASASLGRALGHENIITFDMGGTTAKASLIEDGVVSRSQEYEVGASLSAGSRLLRGSGELIRIPTLDIAEVGAGGGSIARVDRAGALHVGPTSAGAAPGPACYGLGGAEATVTDANVVLGYIPTGSLASGDITVSRELAEAAIARVGQAVGLAPLEAARGVHELANAAMMRALRSVSTERGRDPSDFVLMAYGGSGPVHAAALAAELGVKTAVVPPLAGLFSAAGLLFARAERHDVRFCKVGAEAGAVEQLLRLEGEMRTALATGEEELEWQRIADVRYRGQNWSIPVAWPGQLDAGSVDDLVARFEDAHERLYGTRLEPGSPVDIRALRLIALGPERGSFGLSHEWEPPAAGSTRSADFGPAHGTLEAPVHSRGSIPCAGLEGPLLVDEYDTTVVVPPGWTVSLDAATGALLLVGGAAEPGRRLAAGHEAPIVVRLVANALETAADEMATTIFRTAHSAVVRDAMDFSAALCGPTGETVAQAVTIPLQLGSIPNAMKTLFERFGDRFAPGDIYIVNDPFDGASHTPDVFVVKPSFLGSTLLGFAVTIAHHADVGGRVPGSCACDSTEVFQEGLRLPWLRLYDGGEPVEAIFEILRANVRVPRELLGDLSAQVAACHIGDRALEELAGRYGADGVEKLMAELLDHTEELLRGEIAGWPDGTVTFTDYLDSDGIELADVPITVELTVRGDELVADFSDSAPMVRGALNCTPSFAEASVYHTVMAASAIDIPRTAGAMRPITVITKPGTVTHVVMPGASSMRGVTGYRLSDVMNGALAQLIPGRVPAAGEGGSTLAFFTSRAGGEQWVYSELVVGTWGGRPVSDGNDGLANPCASMANIPVELAESDWPILIERYGLVPDSGGAGRYRGGLAVERVWRALAPDTAVHVRSDRQVHRPYGLAGGGEGAASSSRIERSTGSQERMPPMFVGLLQPGDSFHHRMPGGGVFGDPLERDPEATALDVRDGKVSADAARSLYGVVIGRDGAVDGEATTELRREKVGAR